MNESTSAKSPRFEKSSSKRTILRFGSQSDDDIGDLLATTSPTTSVLDLERELMKRRDKLLSSLQDRALQKEFMRFMSNSKSPGFFLMLHLLSCFSVIQTVFKFRYGQQRFILLWCAAEFALEIVVVVSGWLLYGSINDEESYWGSYTSWLLKGSKPRLREKNADLLQAIYYMACVAVRSLDLIQRTVAGQCPSTDIPHSFSCNNSAHAGSFPMESFFILLLVPVLFVCVLKETRMYLNITAGVVAVFSISLCALLLASGRAVQIMIFYVMTAYVIMADSFKQCLLFYLLSRQLKKMIDANQKLALQNKATEMRHLIANVAHDLKTPLSSFMTGIDIISADIIECMTKLKSSPNKPSSSLIEGIEREVEQEGVTKEYLASMMSGLQSCIVNIRNTNAFMLMTINRCLDYTKASNGLKLVPKNETIDLQETINMPLQCMTNIQNKMKITLQSYEDEGICSHIITDRQWLQENLLCLLSNAVKYSGEGEVLIVVSRVTLPTKVCGQVEDEIITSEPENYQPPLSAMQRQQSQAHLSRKSLSSRFSIRSSQLSVAGSQWLREATSSNSNGIDAMLASMGTRRSILKTSKVAPLGSSVSTVRQVESTQTIRTVHHLEIPSDIEAQDDVEEEEEHHHTHRHRRRQRRPIPHRRMSNASNVSQASSIAVSEKSFYEELMFEVIDPGIGIAEEAMKSLFNPFKQTQRLAGGTGLGLYSLAKRIEALKGKYGVHQRMDGKQGSVFWFTIPYRADTVTAAALTVGVTASGKREERSGGLGVSETFDPNQGPMTSQLHIQGNLNKNESMNLILDTVVNRTVPPSPRAVSIHATATNQNQNLSVLIVEDTPSIAKMTSMMLKRQKHRTEVAENGQIALKMLYEEETKEREGFRKESKEGDREGEVGEGRVGSVCCDVSSEGVRYDVVLMDLQMPVMDGLEATRRIRGREKEKEKMTRHQIVIGVSANSDHETMEEAFKAGIDDFLPKPFSMEAFLKAVHRIQDRLSRPH